MKVLLAFIFPEQRREFSSEGIGRILRREIKQVERLDEFGNLLSNTMSEDSLVFGRKVENIIAIAELTQKFLFLATKPQVRGLRADVIFWWHEKREEIVSYEALRSAVTFSRSFDQVKK